MEFLKVILYSRFFYEIEIRNTDGTVDGTRKSLLNSNFVSLYVKTVLLFQRKLTFYKMQRR